MCGCVYVQDLSRADHRVLVWEQGDPFSSSAFLFNFTAVLLLLFRPVLQKQAENIDKVHWAFVNQNWRIDFAAEPKLRVGGAESRSAAGGMRGRQEG